MYIYHQVLLGKAVPNCSMLADRPRALCDSVRTSVFRIFARYESPNRVRTGTCFLASLSKVSSTEYDAYFMTSETVLDLVDDKGNHLDGIAIGRGTANSMPRNYRSCNKISDAFDKIAFTAMYKASPCLVRCSVTTRDDPVLHAMLAESSVILPGLPMNETFIGGMAYAGDVPAPKYDELFSPAGQPTALSGVMFDVDGIGSSHTCPTKRGMQGFPILSAARGRYVCIHTGPLVVKGKAGSRFNMCVHSLNPGHVCVFFKFIYPTLSWRQQSAVFDYVRATYAIVQRQCPDYAPSASWLQGAYYFLSSALVRDPDL